MVFGSEDLGTATTAERAALNWSKGVLLMTGTIAFRRGVYNDLPITNAELCMWYIGNCTSSTSSFFP